MTADRHERGGASPTDNVSELIQHAALEAIKAVRVFLDVAESVVRDPGTAAVVGRAFADAASAAFRSSTPGDGAAADGRGGTATEEQPGVRRIHLSD